MEGYNYNNGGYMTRRYDSIRDNGMMDLGRGAAPGSGYYLPSSNFNQTSYPSDDYGNSNHYNNFNRMDTMRPGYNNNSNYGGSGGYSDGRNFSNVSYPASYGGSNGGYNNFNGMGASYKPSKNSSYGGWPAKTSSSSNSGQNSLMEKATNVAERAAVKYLSEKTNPVVASTIASAAFPKQKFAVTVPKNGGNGGIEPMELIKEAATRYSNFSASSKKDWR